MNKKNVVHIPATHPAQSVSSSARRNTEVSAQITLSDSILTGAVVEYRKAGYRFIRHMHTSIEIYRILIWISNRRPFIAPKVILL